MFDRRNRENLPPEEHFARELSRPFDDPVMKHSRTWGLTDVERGVLEKCVLSIPSDESNRSGAIAPLANHQTKFEPADRMKLEQVLDKLITDSDGLVGYIRSLQQRNLCTDMPLDLGRCEAVAEHGAKSLSDIELARALRAPSALSSLQYCISEATPPPVRLKNRLITVAEEAIARHAND